MPRHLTADQIASFRDGTLPYTQWAQAFEHTRQCPMCKEAAYPQSEEEQIAAKLLSSLQNSHIRVQHLEFDDLWADASRDYTGRDRQHITEHLKNCERCRREAREVADQRAASSKASKPERSSIPVPWRIAVPALGAIACILFALFFWSGRRVHIEGSRLSDSEQLVVQSALANGRIDIPSEIARLRGENEVLLGPEGQAARLRLLRPIGTAVASQTPRFEWTAISGAEYQVRIFAGYEQVQSSPWIRETTWSTAAPLQRFRIYTWQVAARRGKQEVMAPVPPQPEARFLVSSEQDAQSAARLQRNATSAPVASAVILAHLGFIDDARSVLDGLLAKHPGNESLVRSLRNSLDGMSIR